MRKISMILVALVLLSGCESAQQFQGVYMGSTLGGIFGSSIGGLLDGPRGSDAGTALGMIVGGVAGAAITSEKPKNKSSEPVRRYDNDYAGTTDVDTYNRRNHGKSTVTPIPDGYENLQIENLRFIDQNKNQALDASERAKIVFEIRNNGSHTLYNIAPVVEVTDNKRIIISPTAIVASIRPGKVVRYTAEIYGKPKLRPGIADFSISFASGQTYYTVRRFQLKTALSHF